MTREWVQTQNFGGAVVGKTLLFLRGRHAGSSLHSDCRYRANVVQQSIVMTFRHRGGPCAGYRKCSTSRAGSWRLGTVSDRRSRRSISAILGTFAALAVARGARAKAGCSSFFFLAPMMLPHIVIAIGSLPDVGSIPSCRYIHRRRNRTHRYRRSARLCYSLCGLTQLPGNPRSRGAYTFGAGAWKAFWRVTFPMIWTSIAVGAILALITSFDELMLALFLTSPQTETIPRLIWDQLSYALTPAIAAAASLILLISMVTFRGGGSRWQHEKLRFGK